jgi:hypothetical protein
VSAKSLSGNEKNLLRRYLIWCYKTTKEDLDRVDRYYTQYVADHFMLEELKSAKIFHKTRFPQYCKLVEDFSGYVEKKKRSADSKRYADPAKKEFADQYQYLTQRFSAIEKAIKHFLGANELNRICQLYEQEMTTRILQAREHI